jgi:enoyl-[acyl-carrier protein] reductase / trans-2-enoyl-CoA reductase (NAD+)
MAHEIVVQRMRGFLSTSAHPIGCARMVEAQIAAARRERAAWSGGKLLVLGASTGYGLASRIAGAFAHGMDSVGVAYERPATERRTASAGWYNLAAFDRAARRAGLAAESINGDAFSNDVLAAALQRVRDTLGPLDVFVYSVAAPVRTDPETGVTYRSAIKSVGTTFTTKSIDLRDDRLVEVTIDAATPEEIAATIAVMGGADLSRWVGALLAAGLLAPGARVVAYSYIGSMVTWPVYRHGTIGHAKVDLEDHCAALHGRLQREIGGACRVAIMKSIVSQAAGAIPAVPLYMAILFRVMKDAGLHEGPIEQAVRLFGDQIGPGRTPVVDARGLIRLDDRELRPEIQAEVMRRWRLVTDESLAELSDFEGFRRYFHQLFGFDVPGVDYDVPVEVDVPLA